jgi:hypothetical protein
MSSDHQNLCRPSHGFRCELRIGELGILAGEVRFNHPTGGRTGPSNKNRDLAFHNFRDCLAERRPANRSDVRGNHRAHQYRGISG